MDKETQLAWIICGSKLFIWSYLASAASKNCVVLKLPSTGNDDKGHSHSSDKWLVSVVNWNSKQDTNEVVPHCCSVGVIACDKKSRTLLYWSDIFSDAVTQPIVSYDDHEDVGVTLSPVYTNATSYNLKKTNKHSGSSTLSTINSLISSAIPEGRQNRACVALACSSSGELWQYLCSSTGVQRKRIYQNISQEEDGGYFVGGQGYPRSLVWHFLPRSDKPNKQFLLLTDREIQCFSIEPSPNHMVSKIWSHEIIGTDSDLGIQKDLAGQKRIWPLDLQVDNEGKVITILIAIFCKDRVNSSSYTEYSLLTMQFKSGLIEKNQKHQEFLQFLALSKCHEELCYVQRHSLQIIMEHGEKLAAMIQLRELQSKVSQNHGTESGSHLHSEMQFSSALWDLIQLVGERARRRTVLLMDRDNAEVFYSKVSDLEELFHCLERQFDYVVHEDMPVSVQIQRVCELSNACVILFRTAMNYRNEQHIWYPSPEGLMPWTSQEKVRNGLWKIASFMLQLSKQKYPVDDAIKWNYYSYLEGLSDVLLESYSGAITARNGYGGHKGLLDEFSGRKDALLDSLYQQVKDFVEVNTQDSEQDFTHEHEELFRKLSSGLFSIAKRHEGYQTLWNICTDLNDLNLLGTLMHESMGRTGGFCYFVFQRMYENKQFSKLMRFGEEFQEELTIFLKRHHDLLWLHEVFLHEFSSATETLHVLALSQDDDRISDMEASYASDKRTSLSDRKRFLNLSKIAAMAGRDANFETKVKRIDADLKILNSQEEILRVLPENEMQNIGPNQQLLSPRHLIELCLKSQTRELSLIAFDVFAWTSLSFLKSNASLLEECWRNALTQDDWEKLHQASIAEGWGDEESLSILQDTVLFQASARCYGPHAETFEGSFSQVLPLRQEESSELQNPNGVAPSSSVESILMQHHDFPDAGRLMLTAVMLGSVVDDEKSTRDPSSQMA
ncbi:unnamed protein product [Cuscuta campestris]|uniref:Nucleoporin Nup133/Nup155-like N-terminal domain-containing protein n=1 Tax=Cuscuta campestris TaxID=132261 RepID=A0A484MYQ9_9ASTE|nr:unnamed protein product [Cuscuta campestris]